MMRPLLREVWHMPGRKQPHPFDPAKAARLNDPERERWLPTPELLALLDVPENGRVLDYGTGTGRYAVAIAREYPHATITAYDIQQEMLDFARDRAREDGLANVQVAGPDPQALPDGSFDRILGVHLLHEIDDEHLVHMRGLLAADGSALIVDWEQSVERDVGPPAEHVHTVQEALGRLRRAGFRAHVLTAAHFPYHYAIRCER